MGIKDRCTPHVMGIHFLACQISRWFSIVPFQRKHRLTKNGSVPKYRFAM